MDLNLPKVIKSSERWIPPNNRLNCTKLDLNENNGIFDNEFILKFKKFDSAVITSYPEYDSFLELLSEYTNQPTKNIVLTDGGDQGIDIALHLFFDKKSKVILPSPVFSMYDHILNTLGSKVVHVPYIDNGHYFEFPIEKVLQEISKSQGVILCNPNNPLGYFIKDDDLSKILDKTRDLNIPCIVDEAYFEYYGKTCADKIIDYRNLIIIRSFSKVFGFAGLRLGYVLANDYICKEFLKIRNPWAVNHFAIFAGSIVLQEQDYFIKRMDIFKNRKKNTAELFRNKGFVLYDTVTNFLVVRRDNIDDFANNLRKKNILINNISKYPFSDNLLENTARITIPSDEGLAVLKKAFNKIK